MVQTVRACSNEIVKKMVYFAGVRESSGSCMPNC